MANFGDPTNVEWDMTKRSTRRMTEAEFAACLPFVKNVNADRIAAAKAALVDGESQVVIGARYGWTRQGVNICVDTLWEALKRYHAAQQAASNILMPPGWQQVTLTAPTWLIEKFRAEIAALPMGSADHAREVPPREQ